MYGQFYNEQLLTKKRTKHEPANRFAKVEINRKKILGFISLLLITISFSSASFAGPSQPRLKGGNGNVQGR